MQDLQTLETEITANLAAATDLDLVEAIRIAELGKKGRVSTLMRELGKMTPDEKKEFGPKLNQLKNTLNDAVLSRKDALEKEALNQKLSEERVDITLSKAIAERGSIHPITQVIDEATEIFTEMGFSVAEGPEIEEDFHNFSALNIPESHPARQMHDTFYVESKSNLLRTHTSPVQIRGMLEKKPPLAFISGGKVYRKDDDATHLPMFHQVEGIYVDEGVSFSNLKDLIFRIIHSLFGDDVQLRFRPSYFPFTEPSAEVDILSKDGKWLEILGCGIVNPIVLENCKIDSTKFSGFAFGLGVERIAMLKYGVNDIREFYKSNLDFLNQFK